AEERPVRLATAEGKPVVVQEFSDPEYGRRVDVSRGSHDAGDLVTSSTVSIEKVAEDANLPVLNPARSVEQAQALINDLRNAK
ncbi:MAG TPA: hypothetical protein VLE69_00305, partial [Candidatus Saccharimonadales bacterium]|nr:hypothetical protein [Candidatus Saccharimonadales bacterium]